MPALVVPDGAQMTIRWNAGTLNFYNVLGLRVNAGFVIDQATAANCAAVVNGAWTAASIAGFVDVSTIIVQVGIRDLRAPNMAEYLANTSNTVGTGLGERNSDALACCVTVRTAKAGKRYRGRVYLPLNAEAALDNETSLYTAPACTAAVAFITKINDGFVTQAGIVGQLKLAVVSRGTPEDPATFATPMVSCQVRSQIATTQRRRLPKRG